MTIFFFSNLKMFREFENMNILQKKNRRNIFVEKLSIEDSLKGFFSLA